MSCCDHEHDETFEGSFVDTIQVGKQVPPLVIDAYDAKTLDFCEVDMGKLRAEKKWLLLFFYPADFTFVCPTELSDLADKHKALSDLGVEVVSMSTDTKFAHLAWRQSEKLLGEVHYKMGADPTGNISRMFGIYDEEAGTAFRGTFLINPEGILVGSEINLNNVGRNAEELLRKVEANVYLSKHPNEVCPAKWQKGMPTLTPSTKMVGDVYSALKK